MIVRAAIACLIGIAGCHKTEEPVRGGKAAASAAAPSGSAGAVAVGSPIVAAISKTSFREGKVAKIDAGKVTVEAAADESGRKPSWTVAAAKVWPLNGVADAKAGEPLVCRTAERAWYPCTVVSAGERATIEDAYGARHELGAADLLRPDEAEQGDIKTYLAEERARRELDAALEKAGPPARAAGWEPKKGDAVIAHFVGSAWYGATVIAVKPKAKARIRWAGDAWPERDLPLEEIAPMPPAGAVKVGDLVLGRPARAEAAWDVGRVSAVNGGAVELTLRDGGKRSAEARDLVPFGK